MESYSIEAVLSANVQRFVDGFKRATDSVEDFAKQNKRTMDAFKVESFGKKMSSVGESLSGVGDKLTKNFTLPAVGAAAALAGITLAKGFGRLVSIDTARAKLKALGHDSDSVSVIMDSALASVKGTAFGLGDAATAAASAVAAGIKPGKELTQYLTNVGDAAAIAGVEFSDMGSIFNKIQTGGKATRMELNQMADRGLPVFQWLAEAAGESEEAIQEMVTKGQISSELFNKAIKKNIGGAAGIMGSESFTAAAANVWAAVGRIGASFLDAGGEGGGFFSQLKPLMANFTDKLDGMGDIAVEWGVKFGAAVKGVVDKAVELKAKWDELSPPIQELIKKAALFGGAFLIGIGPVLSIVGKVVSAFGGLLAVFGKVAGVVSQLGGVMSLLTGPIGLTVLSIGLLIAAVILAYKKVEWFRDMVDAAWAWIKKATSVAFGYIKDFISKMIADIVAFGKEQLAVFRKFWDENGAQIMDIVKTYFNFIKGYIKMVLGLIKGYFQVIWPAISGVLKIAWESMKLMVKQGITFILGTIKTILAILRGDWKGAWTSIKDTAKSIWKNIEGFFKAVNLVQIGKDIIRGLIKGISSMAKAVGDAVTKVTSAITGKVKSILGIKSPSRVFMGFGDNISAGLAIGIDKAAGLAEKAADALGIGVTDAFNPNLALGTSDIAGQVNSINAQASRQMNSHLTSEINVTKQPARIVLQLGNNDFESFVDDINTVNAVSATLRRF